MGFVSGHAVTNVFYGLSWLCSPISPHPLPRSVMQLVRFRNPCMLPRLRTSAQRARTGCPLTRKQDVLIFMTISAAFLRVCFLLLSLPAAWKLVLLTHIPYKIVPSLSYQSSHPIQGP